MLNCRNYLTIVLTCRSCVQNRCLSLTVPNFLNQKFRKEKGLPLNPNASGVLTDSPDYSFLDGRLTPLAQGQRRRLLRQQEAKDQIIALSKEIDFAVERHRQMLIEEDNRKQQILNSKLKPKGLKLLKSKE